MDILQNLTNILKEHKKGHTEFDLSTTFDSLGFDSLDKAEILMDIEKEFKIEFDLNEDFEVDTVGELVKMIEKLVN